MFTISPDATPIWGMAGISVPLPPVSGSYPIVRAGTITTTNDACNALPAGSLTGSMALIRRGTCTFYMKVMNAQNAGALGVIIYNNVAGPAPSMSVAGTPLAQIPAVSITQADGTLIDGRLQGGPVSLTWTDKLSPFITSVTSTTADGVYGRDSSIDVTLHFSEPVTSASPGGLYVSLNSGASLIIDSAAIQGVTSVTAIYTVQPNQSTTDLNVVGVIGSVINALGGMTGFVGYASVPVGQNLGDSKNIVIDSPAVPPSVITGAATAISSGSATLNGKVNAYNSTATVSFEYGLTSSYGTTVAATPYSASGISDTAVSAAIVNLNLGSSYHFRVVATTDSSGITYYGDDATFTVFPISTGFTVSGSVVLNKGGSISCNSPITSGSSSICRLTPATGWYIASLADNSIDVPLSQVLNYQYTIANITADHAVAVTFQEYFVRRISNNATYFHLNIQDAFDNAVNSDKIMLLNLSFPGAVSFNKPTVSVEVEGGYDSGFLSKTGVTEINGRMDIRDGKVVMKNISIR
jgi:hypothetical protein